MIDETKIQAAVVDKLKRIGISTSAGEVKEGFEKPTAFASVAPTSVERLNACREHITTTVTIQYVPETETVEECAQKAGKIRLGFFYEPLEIEDRKLTIENIDFEYENNILNVYFDLDFIQEIPDNEEYEPMENLEIGGDI